MIDYDSIDLKEFQKDYESYKNGSIKKKELNQKYGLNQNSLKIIEKMLNKLIENQSTNCKAEIDTV